MARAAGHATASKTEEIAYRVAATYLDYERAVRAAAAAQAQVETWQRLERLVEERVRAEREIPLELTRARLETARARARLQDLQANADLLQETLRSDLALEDSSRIVPVETQAPAAGALPATEQAAVEAALGASPEIKRLESVAQARRFGREAELIHPDGSRLRRAPELLEELGGLVGAEAVSTLVDLSQADEQLEVGRADGLEALCRRLVELT